MTEREDEQSIYGSFQQVEPVSSEVKPPVKKRRLLFLLGSLVAVIILGFLGFILISNPNSNDPKKVQGKYALSERELRDVVNAKHLLVYWAGPVTGDKYALVAQKTGQSSVRYLPAGLGLADTKGTFRIVATYAQKDAFSITEAAGAQVGNVGFTNVDGNSVFYVKTRPTNVYMGIQAKDIQIEIFDPVIDQALAIALFRGEIRQVN